MADRMLSRRRDEKGERSPDEVPSYVAKGLRKLSAVTVSHIDVTRLIKDIITTKVGLAEMKYRLNASQNTITGLHADIVKLRNKTAVCRSSEFASTPHHAYSAAAAELLSIFNRRGTEGW